MLKFTLLAAAAMLLVSCKHVPVGGDNGKRVNADRPWRTLPLITGGKVDPAWSFTGYGVFSIDRGALRTDCDERGLGLLVYAGEKFGDCQIRVVYRSKDPKANSGVYVRIDDGMIPQLRELPAPATRENGELTAAGLVAMQGASESEVGPWYAVHHGYEVQIADDADEFHRTGAIYSLNRAEAAPSAGDGAWRTMIITLSGETVTVEVDGKHVSTFDAAAGNLPERKQWYEPKREPKRPTHGYIGLQTHDPGDVVWFKEVSVRPIQH